MSFLPGWDSVDSTATIAHNLHVTAVVVLGLLFLAEGMALIYDSRNHHLVGVAQVAADAKAKTNQDALQQQLTEADKKLAEVERRNAPRQVSAESKAKLASFLAGKPTGKLLIYALSGVADSKSYGSQIGGVFREAGWAVEERDALVFGDNLNGLWMAVRDRNSLPQALYVAHTALIEAGIPVRKEINVENIVPEGEAVALKVGFNN